MWISAILVTVGVADTGGAAEPDAKAHNDRAIAAFALGQYAEAAQEYEAAFKLRPLSELLYNAAQSHRIAGNKARALLLYQNYLRVFAA